MARNLPLSALAGEEFRKLLLRTIQSGNLNFLIGSGASVPAIPSAGQIEKELDSLLEQGKEEEAYAAAYKFLYTVQQPTNALIAGVADPTVHAVLNQYVALASTIGNLLAERKTNLLPKQATIFTTNYDLFLEQACISDPTLRLNDGFMRSPSLGGRMIFSPRTFFNSTYNSGNLYSYRVEVPTINLIKLHGSLSWAKEGDEIAYAPKVLPPLPPNATPAMMRTRIEEYAVVLPQAAKFRTTLMDRTYYELLRMYANELDRENTALLSFGFSFGDVHVLDITRRALKNPTLRLMVFAYDAAAASGFHDAFAQFTNVDIVTPSGAETLSFPQFNSCLASLLLSGVPV